MKTMPVQHHNSSSSSSRSSCSSSSNNNNSRRRSNSSRCWVLQCAILLADLLLIFDLESFLHFSWFASQGEHLKSLKVSFVASLPPCIFLSLPFMCSPGLRLKVSAKV